MSDTVKKTQEMYTQDIASEELLAADVMAGVSALVDYAAVLHRYGGRDFLPDLRDLTADMIWVWGPEDEMESPEGQTELQREYYKRITAAEKRPLAKAVITARQAEAIVRGLSIHAEEMAEQGDLLPVWQCCRLARHLREGFNGETQQPLVLYGNFEIDESRRFMKFGVRERDQVTQGLLCEQPVLVFNDPIPAEQVPDGWYCYHLSGRNIRASDRLWSVSPRYDYVGSVLTQTELIQTRRNMIRVDGQFTMDRNPVSLDGFCEQHGFQTEDFDRLFPEREMRQSRGGMSLG